MVCREKLFSEKLHIIRFEVSVRLYVIQLYHVLLSTLFFTSGIQKLVDRWHRGLNKFGQYVEK